jgi:uncharacterized protein (DUF3084 family)
METRSQHDAEESLARDSSRDDGGRSPARETSRARDRQGFAPAGIEELKRVLRERVNSVAAREQELVEARAQLATRLADLDKKAKTSRRDEKQLGEREQQLAAREEELGAQIGAAEQREREAASKLSLASAEREKLDERERAVKDIERELAGQRRRLEAERATLLTPDARPAAGDAQTD